MIRMWDPLNPKKIENDYFSLNNFYLFDCTGIDNRTGEVYNNTFIYYQETEESITDYIDKFDALGEDGKKTIMDIVYNLADKIEELYNITIFNIDMRVIREPNGLYFMNEILEDLGYGN